jgi:hypothetical protein
MGTCQIPSVNHLYQIPCMFTVSQSVELKSACHCKSKLHAAPIFDCCNCVENSHVTSSGLNSRKRDPRRIGEWGPKRLFRTKDRPRDAKGPQSTKYVCLSWHTVNCGQRPSLRVYTSDVQLCSYGSIASPVLVLGFGGAMWRVTV